jgi:D-tagatose-1,6-bisphosphate aldolase subunit GatZ/KbaZ
MYLHDVVRAQRSGKPAGVPSICSAHPAVLRETLRMARSLQVPALIESTCNQVNQFGGYTGLTPADFASTIRHMAEEAGLASTDLILGGDHLGPSPWQAEPAEAAMQKAGDLVLAYVQAGFVKLHLDCSMPLGGDGPAGPAPDVVAARAAQLAQVAQQGGRSELQFVIGTEVPPPGGAKADGEYLQVTSVEHASQAIESHRAAFHKLGLDSAWERVVAVVVQPGVEFGDDFVAAYQPAHARQLARFIETQSLVYEAHSTDYQSPQALRQMVGDHFAILKVGPALTFAYREAAFALALMEDELFPSAQRSNLIAVVDQAMVQHPQYWEKYYAGSAAAQAFKRRYSLSDRVRYYWVQPEVQRALERLLGNLRLNPIPLPLLSQFAPLEMDALAQQGLELSPDAVISQRIGRRLGDYFAACRPDA